MKEDEKYPRIEFMATERGIAIALYLPGEVNNLIVNADTTEAYAEILEKHPASFAAIQVYQGIMDEPPEGWDHRDLPSSKVPSKDELN